MASVNKVILIGNLGADPEMRSTANGEAVCNLRLATTETWKDKSSGEKKESTEWHRVVLYRRLGETAGRYLSKGSKVYIEGRIRTRRWQDKQGIERLSTEIEASEMTMLGSRASASESIGVSPVHGHALSRPASAANPSTPPSWLDDDYPF